MYSKIGIKELGKRLTGTIASVETGKGRIVTRRSRPVACIVPIEQAREVGLLDDSAVSDSERASYYRQRSRNLFEAVASLAEDAPDHVDALEVEYRRRKAEPDRVGDWAS